MNREQTRLLHFISVFYSVPWKEWFASASASSVPSSSHEATHRVQRGEHLRIPDIRSTDNLRSTATLHWMKCPLRRSPTEGSNWMYHVGTTNRPRRWAWCWWTDYRAETWWTGWPQAHLLWRDPCLCSGTKWCRVMFATPKESWFRWRKGVEAACRWVWPRECPHKHHSRKGQDRCPLPITPVSEQ